MDWEDKDLEEKEFWESIGTNEGYTGENCENCGRNRVEHWSCGKDICEKCHWCKQLKDYYGIYYFE